MLLDLVSLNYEFGGCWKMKQNPSKTTISLWLRHVQGPVLGPRSGHLLRTFFKMLSLKGCWKAMVFQACKWGLGQGLRSWRGWRRPNVGEDSGSYSNSVVALSNVKMASRPCLARWYLVNFAIFEEFGSLIQKIWQNPWSGPGHCTRPSISWGGRFLSSIICT